MKRNKSKREINIEQLETASEALREVTPLAPRPLQPLELALSEVASAYNDMQSYLGTEMKRSVRVAVNQMRGVMTALKENRRITDGDYAAMSVASSNLADVAQSVRNKMAAKGEILDRSLSGSRFLNRPVLDEAVPFVTLRNGREVAAAGILDETLQDRWHDMEEYREKLPRRLKPGMRFSVFRCPLVVYTKSMISDIDMDRSGLKWFRLSGSDGTGWSPGAARRLAGNNAHAYLLYDQVLVGMDRVEMQEDRSLVERVLKQVQQRMGSMVTPLDHRCLVSPGSQLNWTWLLPSRVMNATHMTVREASFPWKSDHVNLTENQQLQVRREIDSIQRQQQERLLNNRPLDVSQLTRESQLREHLDRAKGTPNLELRNQIKKEMNDAIARRTLRARSEIKALQDQLADAKDVPGQERVRREWRNELKQLQMEIERVTREEMRKAQNRLR